MFSKLLLCALNYDLQTYPTSFKHMKLTFTKQLVYQGQSTPLSSSFPMSQVEAFPFVSYLIFLDGDVGIETGIFHIKVDALPLSYNPRCDWRRVAFNNILGRVQRQWLSLVPFSAARFDSRITLETNKFFKV